MPLADVQYQSDAHRQMQRAISQGRMAHAYIFHGPDGVGKEMFARALSQRLLCDKPVEAILKQPATAGEEAIQQGCGKCQECVAVANGSHPDVHSVYRQLIREHPDAALRKRKALELGVNVIRHFVVDKASLTPLRGKMKIYIIREADRITIAAQNALLKTLEEPPGAALIILLATHLSRLLPTTLSRCQVLAFNPLPDAFVRQTLSETQPELTPAHASWYARMAGGSMGTATVACNDNQFDTNTKLIDQLVSLSAQSSSGISRAWIEESKSMSSQFRQRDPDISESEASRRGLLLLIKLAATWYGDILHLLAHDDAGLINAQNQAQLQRVSRRMQLDHAIEAIRRCSLAEYHLQRNANTQLSIETLVNDLARLSTGKPAISAA